MRIGRSILASLKRHFQAAPQLEGQIYEQARVPFANTPFLSWLLQVDRSVPARPAAEVTAEIQRNYTWNFAVNLLDGAFYWFGGAFISVVTILPLFISKLTTSPLPIGLLAMIGHGGWYLPQVFTAGVVERLPRKKPVVVNLGLFIERLPLWLLVIAALVAGEWPEGALAILLVGYAASGLGAGLVATAWQELIARCFPVERRGMLFGLTSLMGAVLGVIGASLSAWLLQILPFPTNFACLFSIGASSIMLSWCFLALTREPAQVATVPHYSDRDHIAGLWVFLREDHNFRRFLIARLFLTMGGMGMGFVTVAAVQRWQIADSTVGFYTMLMLLGQIGSNLAFGFIADRLGHKLSLEIGALAFLFSFGLAWLSPLPEGYCLVFLVLGLGLGAIMVSELLIVLEFSPSERRPTYIGIANTSAGVAAVAGPMVATALVGVGYNWLFATSATFSLAALVLLHWWVIEPRLALVTNHNHET